jgi:hypothetical protein
LAHKAPKTSLRRPHELDQATAAQVAEVPFGGFARASKLRDDLGLTKIGAVLHPLDGPLLTGIVCWVIVALYWVRLGGMLATAVVAYQVTRCLYWVIGLAHC